MKPRRFFLFFFLISFLWACKQQPSPPNYTIQKSAVGDTAMVVSPHPLATEVGLEIIKKGGNAVDAAVAVQFAIAVVFPRAGNIGGGGFMVIRFNDGATDAIDYREKAPLAADRDMYLDSIGDVINGLSTLGHLAVGVPGTVDGLIQAHQKYGKLDFASLIEPAIRLAENGYKLTITEAKRISRYQQGFQDANTMENVFMKDTFLEGELLRQKDLAHTLRLIKENGRDGFYAGETADKMVAEMQRGNGLITHEDLKQYKAQWRKPIVGSYKNYNIISMPPSSSGGVALLQMLEMIEPYPIADWGPRDLRSVHLLTEAERRAYADRAKHMGDSDFYDVPLERLLDSAYLDSRMLDFSMDSATVSENIIAGYFKLLKESFETTHTSVVDAEGNAVSLTTTLNSNFGSKVMVGNAGFFLNNEMDDFSAKPGVPNQFGLVGTEANAIQPGKRMLSSMTPTIVEKDGELFLVIGAPGGATIITAVFQVFLNVAEFGMDLSEAVDQGRFHHQWLPDVIAVERGAFSDQLMEEMKTLGHDFREVERMAVIKAIHVREDGKLHGVGDRRNPDDDAKGY
jgi:gamma-glutamyltranspeptidase/glutathione hydrolase